MAKVIVNFSGGKDSTVAILEAIKHYPKEDIILCLQDTGAEYLETVPHAQSVADMLGLPLVILKSKRDWYEQVEHDRFFFTPAIRKCTSTLKQDVFYSWVAHNREKLGSEIIVVYGIRGEESLSRSKMFEWDIHKTTLKNGTFKAYSWRPCLHMRKQEIYDRIKAEGLPLHPCYEFSDRCNCWLCIFAAYNEVRTYAEMHPDLWEKACLLEDKVKHKWKEHFAINDLMKQGRLF